MTDLRHTALLDIVTRLPSDFEPYGERARLEMTDSDCSGGCRWFLPLAGDLGCDWGVCSNPKSPRRGLLTFEHQGCREFELDPDEEQRTGDALLARMQRPEAGAGMQAAFEATPEQLGQAAVAAALDQTGEREGPPDPDVLRLSARDSERVAGMLLHPPAPNARLITAAGRLEFTRVPVTSTRSMAAAAAAPDVGHQRLRGRRPRLCLPLWHQALRRRQETR